MGSSQSKSESKDPTQDAELYDQSENCKFFRNASGQQFEKYEVIHNNQPDFENRFQFRIKNPSPYLVNAFYAQPLENSFGCTSQTTFSVVTQKIKERLSTLHHLSPEQSLNFVDKSLRGYQQLFKSNGIILVKDNMIGISWDNEVKVWLNANFYQNHSQAQPISYKMLMQEDKQSIMVDNIIELINSRASRQALWRQFMEEKYSKGRLNFNSAIDLVEEFCRKKSIPLNKKIYSIQTRRDTQTFSKPNQIKKTPTYHSLSRINSTDSHHPKRPSTFLYPLDKSKFSNSLQLSKTGQQQSSSQKKSISIHYGQPEKPSNSMRIQKTSNLSSIRHKIVNGPNYTPVVSASNGFQQPGYRPVTFTQQSHPQTLSGKKDLSQSPQTLHRFTLNNIELNKTGKQNSPQPYSYSPSPFQSKLPSYKLPSSNSYTNIQNTSYLIENKRTGNQRVGGENILISNVGKQKRAVENPFDLIEKNKITKIILERKEDRKQSKEQGERVEEKDDLRKEEMLNGEKNKVQVSKQSKSMEKIEIEHKQVQNSDKKEDLPKQILNQKEKKEKQHQKQEKIHINVSKIQQLQPKNYIQLQSPQIQPKSTLQPQNPTIQVVKEDYVAKKGTSQKEQREQRGNGGILKQKGKFEENREWRMEEQKKSRELKGMISYKDLRNLLRSTKEQKYD